MIFNEIRRCRMGIPRGLFRLALFCAASILLLGFPCATGGASMDIDLDDYQWKNRIILVFAPSSDSEAYARQMGEFEGEEDGILDRDLVILELFKNGESRAGDTSLSARVAQRLRSQFNVEADEFSIILMGKDGTVKLRSPVPVPVSEIFGRIDAMPMRQEEMRRRKNLAR